MIGFLAWISIFDVCLLNMAYNLLMHSKRKIEKTKPVVKQGRKATGLKVVSIESRVAF